MIVFGLDTYIYIYIYIYIYSVWKKIHSNFQNTRFHPNWRMFLFRFNPLQYCCAAHVAFTNPANSYCTALNHTPMINTVEHTYFYAASSGDGGERLKIGPIVS